MKKYTPFAPVLLGLIFALCPFVSVSAASVAVQSVLPSTSVFAKTGVSFVITSSGFQSPTYHLIDSFGGTTASVNNIDPGGRFAWTPLTNDVGSHLLTITVTDNDGNTAQATQSITVLPAPSIAIQSVSSNAIMAGTKLTFRVVPSGFTNPTYLVGDEFSGTSIGNQNIDSAGNFSWMPDLAQNGTHTITVYANDSSGHSSEAKVVVQVGAGPTLSIYSLLPGSAVALGQTVTFTATPLNYSPTGFSVRDVYAGVTSVSGSNISSSGLFSWTPQGTEVGTHVITIIGSVGAYGQSASTTQTITVLGSGGAIPTPTVAATSTALTTLQAQLAALQAQIASHASSVTVPMSTGTPVRYVFKKLIKMGQNGTDVKELQKALFALGFLTDEPTGHFGKLTEAAVKKFQAAHGLETKGYVGPGTRAALNQ